MKTAGIASLAAPANDDCSGAILIPDGPFPVVTTPVDITDATPQDADDGLHPCALFDAGADRTVWYAFTPSLTGAYVFSTCGGNGATGSTVYDTVLSVFASTGGSCPEGALVDCNDTDGACDFDLPGSAYVDQSTLTAPLAAGTTYFIVVGHWTEDLGGVGPGLSDVALRVDLSPAPANDNCSNPTALTLNQVTEGTTVAANNDYKSVGDATCFSGIGQTPTTSSGLDVVFSFTAPADGTYNFRYVQDDGAAALRAQNPSLYLSHSCPEPAPTGPAVPCIQGANRIEVNGSANGNRSEEISCVPMTSGEQVYLYFDDAAAGNAGGPLAVEVTRCVTEIEPNDDVASANPYPGCSAQGGTAPTGGSVCLKWTEHQFAACDLSTDPTATVCGRTCLPGGAVLEGTPCTSDAQCQALAVASTCQPFRATNCVPKSTDVDFWSVGTPPAGAKVFASATSQQANISDFEMRITNTTDTLGYDDDDGTSWIGSNAPVIGGVVADGNPLYVRVSSQSASEPYHVYWHVETGTAQDEVDAPPPFGNASYYYGNHVTGGGFVRGIMATQTDEDCFRFVAHEGDEIAVFADNNPDRTPGTITNVWPVLRDLGFPPPPPTATRFVGQVVRNDLTPSAGTLTGVTPSVTSNFYPYRARYTGLYMACFTPTQDVAFSENPPAGFYPLPYQGSISLNCGPIPAPASRLTDVSVTTTGPVGPVNTGALIEYTITLANDTSDIAEDVRLQDTLPQELVYLGLSVDDGFAGNNVGCISLPTPGTADAPIDCTAFAIAPGASVTYTLQAQVANCIGAGVDVAHTASIITLSTDPNPANDTSTSTFTTAEDGTCSDLLCDVSGCITNECTVNGQCSAGVCLSDVANCDDDSLCTDDTCDPTDTDGNPCVNDSSQVGDLCFDGNDCTLDACDPLLFCVFPAGPADSACDDFLNCTDNDHCDGAGNCLSHSVCDDGQPCTDDFADEQNACACSNPVSFQGTACDDGTACTSGTVCDGNGGGAANCNGGTSVDCDDANPCTDDSCDPVTGCVHANNTTACDDGDACTAGDACGGGTCHGGAPRVCTDGNACTTDTCNPASGCVFTNNTGPCEDGNFCTTGDTCSGGACITGTPLDCDDGNACTDDECLPGEGCSNLGNTDACDDGDDCTTNDACSGGTCTGGPRVVCDDGDACTAESCVTGTGCVGAPVNLDASGFSSDRIDGRDLVVFATAWNSCPATPFYNPAANLDGGTTPPGSCVDLTDFHLFMTAFGQSCP